MKMKMLFGLVVNIYHLDDHKENITRIECRTIAKKELRRDPNQSIRSVYTNSVVKLDRDLTNVPTLKSLSSTLFRTRSEEIPSTHDCFTRTKVSNDKFLQFDIQH
jgi:hypothetical protein